MVLALGTAALVLVVLVWELCRSRVLAALRQMRAQLRARSHESAHVSYDPGRERRAEQRARELLRSCVEPNDWEMYRDLGFLRVWGGLGEREHAAGASYAYLIYPHRPIVAYVPRTGALLNEYCVAFPDHSRPYGSARLPDADDVLAKWMALKADERRLIDEANMHLPGRQVDPERVGRDLLRLSRWERGPRGVVEQGRVERATGAGGAPDIVRAA
jgi:hypothetical protein